MKALKYAQLFIFTVILFYSALPDSQRIITQASEFLPEVTPKDQTPDWDLRLIKIKQALKYFDPAIPVVVAVIDTGIDTEHPKLKEHLWVNPRESGVDDQGRPKATNNIDDDRNGYIDDVHGWNFANHNNKVSDTHGHGTHVSGIITRVSPHVRIMVLKYYDPSSDGGMHMLNTIRSINYARKMGAHIINYSAGGLSENRQEKLAIERAGRENILFVAAAGNEGMNSDIVGYYPASYPLENVISVTAIGPAENILRSSNFSSNQVDIAAPGENIHSTLPGGRYGILTGTSQATAFVSGVAALLMRQQPQLNKPEFIVDHLVKTGTINDGLADKVRLQSQLNAYLALTKQSAPEERFSKADIVPKNIFKDQQQTVIQRAPTGSF